MRTSERSGFASRLRDRQLFRSESAVLASISGISRVPSTRLLRSEQLRSDHVQIGERRRDFQPVQVLGQAPVSHLAEAEDILHHAEHMLDLGAYPRLVAVLRLIDLIDPAVEAIPFVREVLGARCPFVDDGALATVSLVTPNP